MGGGGGGGGQGGRPDSTSLLLHPWSLQGGEGKGGVAKKPKMRGNNIKKITSQLHCINEYLIF